MIVLVIDPAPKAGLFSGYIGGELIVRSRSRSLTVREPCWRAGTIRRRLTTCGTQIRTLFPSLQRPLNVLLGWMSARTAGECRFRKFNPSEDMADADRPLNEVAECNSRQEARQARRGRRTSDESYKPSPWSSCSK
jgi:hypothetical protein